jgi:2-polyprenyl-3-methyl-5-hydroxy-6-metoxy-1,4-benzoquinol methylase
LNSALPDLQSGDLELLWRTDNLPFTIGARPEARNPEGLPDILPFLLALDVKRGLLVQRSDLRTREALDRAYQMGSLLGTPMDDTPIGRIYADDFVSYLASQRSFAGTRVLEIGCGRGYLLRRMTDLGASVLGVEPGRENAPYWSRYSVEVINDRFPTAHIQQKFQTIICYGVLEHIEKYGEFLEDVKLHLCDDGVLVIAVPDERPYIEDGDPAMLAHEHFLYFTSDSLSRLLSSHGYTVRDLKRATQGGVLYCAATFSGRSSWASAGDFELAAARSFAAGCTRVEKVIKSRVTGAIRNKRTLGIYCPARGLATLPQTGKFRFFDDDPELSGRFYPPFSVVVEPRSQLLDRPVDELLILSRTFGVRLKDELSSDPRLATCSISTVTELLAR